MFSCIYIFIEVDFIFLAQKNRLDEWASKPLLDPEFEVVEHVEAFGSPLENRHLHLQALVVVPNTPRASPLSHRGGPKIPHEAECEKFGPSSAFRLFATKTCYESLFPLLGLALLAVPVALFATSERDQSERHLYLPTNVGN